MNQPVAVIGYHFRFPGAESDREFWSALKGGVRPASSLSERGWPLEQLAMDFALDCRHWLGKLLDQIDGFDAQLLEVPSEEARRLDPQQWAMLDSAWGALEHAGYANRKKISALNVGFYAASMWQDYGLVLHETGFTRRAYQGLGSSLWNLANTASFVFNFSGPSVGIDTACSSALTAVHLACQALVCGECRMALAGAVNLVLHPFHYIYLAKEKHLASSEDKKCFAAGEEGYLPAEGVATLVLKRLEDAKRDHDYIHAVIRSTGINHSGRSPFYKAPQIERQAELVRRVVEEAGVDPATITHLEMTAYGSEVLDTAEMVSLVKAFRKLTSAKQFCGLGSLKPQLGHMEAAAGMAQIIKVLLQLRHGERLPVVHHQDFVKEFSLNETAFFMPESPAAWTAEFPRRAAVHCVGGGGSNGHAIMEEYLESKSRGPWAGGAAWLPIFFSAPDPGRLAETLLAWKDYLADAGEWRLADVAFTLSVGRASLASRAAFLVSSLEDLKLVLAQAARTHEPGKLLAAPGWTDSSETPGLLEAVQAWCSGGDFEWEKHFPAARRVPLPISLRVRARVSEKPASASLPLTAARVSEIFADAASLKSPAFGPETELRKIALGFHAIKKIHGQLEEAAGPLPGNFIFQFKTLAELAAALEQKVAQDNQGSQNSEEKDSWKS